MPSSICGCILLKPSTISDPLNTTSALAYTKLISPFFNTAVALLSQISIIVTVMFIDLQDFTKISENTDPEALIDWLNTYMGAMARLVMEHGGMVDDYIGDGLKANFGVPFRSASEVVLRRDALSAVNCALAMGTELKRLNEIWRAQNLPTAAMRVGIVTGPVVAGSVGNERRLKYTTIGDTVNIASRLENYGKEAEKLNDTNNFCRILIDENTLSFVGREFIVQKVGQLDLKGKSKKVTAYRVIGKNTGSTPGDIHKEMEV
jgi:adenylate cyclase